MRNRVLVVEGQQLMREGLVSLLSADEDFEVVGHTGDGMDGVRLSQQRRPSCVIMDLMNPGLNGVDATRRIVSAVTTTRVVCLTNTAESKTLAAALEAGATALLTKDCPYDELRQALHAQLRRQIYLSPRLTAQALEHVKPAGPACSFSRLTAREREVVQLISEGLSTKAIANRLGVSSKTIATHREHVMSKLNVHSVADLTRYAIREGLSSL